MTVRRLLSPLFWALAQIGSRVRVGAPRGLPEPSTRLPAPTGLRIPTRHGVVRAVVQRPAVDDPGAPVVLQLHGGGFVNRYPEQDLHIARAMADRLGAVVVLPDYDTGPRVQYPVAEEEACDTPAGSRRRPAPDGPGTGSCSAASAPGRSSRSTSASSCTRRRCRLRWPSRSSSR